MSSVSLIRQVRRERSNSSAQQHQQQQQQKNSRPLPPPQPQQHTQNPTLHQQQRKKGGAGVHQEQQQQLPRSALATPRLVIGGKQRRNSNLSGGGAGPGRPAVGFNIEGHQLGEGLFCAQDGVVFNVKESQEMATVVPATTSNHRYGTAVDSDDDSVVLTDNNVRMNTRGGLVSTGYSMEEARLEASLKRVNERLQNQQKQNGREAGGATGKKGGMMYCTGYSIEESRLEASIKRINTKLQQQQQVRSKGAK
eukprot:PhF_6_TR34949/c0_g3_i2/m.50680